MDNLIDDVKGRCGISLILALLVCFTIGFSACGSTDKETGTEASEPAVAALSVDKDSAQARREEIYKQ